MEGVLSAFRFLGGLIDTNDSNNVFGSNPNIVFKKTDNIKDCFSMFSDDVLICFITTKNSFSDYCFKFQNFNSNHIPVIEEIENQNFQSSNNNENVFVYENIDNTKEPITFKNRIFNQISPDEFFDTNNNNINSYTNDDNDNEINIGHDDYNKYLDFLKRNKILYKITYDLRIYYLIDQKTKIDLFELCKLINEGASIDNIKKKVSEFNKLYD